MRKTATLFGLLACFFLGQHVQAANATVTISDFAYSPNQVTINAGESVTWQWSSGTHPTMSNSTPSAWATFTLGSGNPTFTQVFNTPGTYAYHCTAHPAMTGTIRVLAGPTGLGEDQQKGTVLIAYPNPASGLLKLALQTSGAEKYEVRFTNAIGRTVKTISAAELPAAGKDLEVDLSSLPAGIYFYGLWNQDKLVENKRLILSK
ncbi:T9SS type A sorting domain-containing protein [Adhaeribacter soli]|uniref:T9SS type A sorting domain-containing protein n=1 Tax=Adhaeribacter soli TaxID=2607655 RepID=A0A5N1IK17_9BACT|nr:T9SS type A sorting domain-containing protein [Adhaeribacter soli]KAA9325476.1 T9SS type A sorting domain-containing protein [Adhaeribacter soli]